MRWKLLKQHFVVLGTRKSCGRQEAFYWMREVSATRAKFGNTLFRHVVRLMGRDEKHAEDIMVAWSLRLSFQGLEPCIGAAESLRP